MKTTTNVFLDGLTTDMHPLTTSQQLMTDALNATLITFNGNELMLLNDMGNTKIQDSKTGNIMSLRKGYVPVGMTEHGGVIYIASVNKEGKGEIGTIPSPIITYKNLLAVGSTNINFNWAADKDESDTFIINNEILNPEDGFIVYLENTSEISTLEQKHLYIPHLMAITSKAEKDITPTKKLVEEESWFGSYTDQKPITEPDLETLNQINDKETVNFLTYPKIESGKLGIKFTKENIKSFNIAPNKGGRFYPVLQYIKESSGKKKYYSSIYGVQYETESGVSVDKIVITTTINGSKESITYQKVLNKIGHDLGKIENNPIFEFKPEPQNNHYYLCRHQDALPLWPESDSEYSENDKPLYTIDLGDNFNQWVDLTIEYYHNGWGKPLGTYHITYNPYYMDSLDQFITGYFWKLHAFSNGKSSFVQYREYIPGEEPLETYILTLTIGNGTQIEINVDPENSDIKSYEKDNLNFYDDDPGFRPLNIPFSEQQSWSFILPEKQTDTITILDTKSTYLKLEPYIKNALGNTEILDASIEIPISIYSTDVKDWLDNRAARNSDGLTGNLLIEYQYSIKKEGDSTNITSGYGTSEIENIKVVNNHPISIIEIVVQHGNEDVTLKKGSSLIDSSNNRIYGNDTIKSIKYKEGIEYTYKKNSLGIIEVDEEIKNIFFYNNLSKYEKEDDSAGFISELLNHVKNEILKKQGLDDFPTVEWHPALQFSFHNWLKNNYIDFNTSININLEGLKYKEYSTDPYILNFKIKKILTNKLLHYLQYSRLNTSVYVSAPILTLKYNKEARADVFVPYKSECYVYPLYDLFVNMQNNDNSISEVPAQLVNNIINPIIIDYKKNYITLSGNKMSTPTGYTRKNTSNNILASFNLEGIEEYREKATVEKLTPGKIYLFRNGDSNVSVTINSGSKEVEVGSGSYCILKPKETSIYTLISNKGFRSLGIYEFIEPIKVAQSVKEDIISGTGVLGDINKYFSYNNDYLINHALLSVYCYNEFGNTIEKEGYTEYIDDVIVKVNGLNPRHNTVKFECSPVPEFGYQKMVDIKPEEITEVRDVPNT